MGLLDPSTFTGALLIGVIAGLITGGSGGFFYAKKIYKVDQSSTIDKSTNVNQKGIGQKSEINNYRDRE
ncbi:hypothetical protein [Halobacillus amylolyticus]|uniref:Uncharacterized protein n=1 Tax=Halobacillus amylolyticus TaxID=2932259 RepID=A0ABY4HB56_9BACI|nr:hypothetical protein [Halobacillus amylolyticus]UOR12099.1 hypothetical protein MUO15_00705 [Halobacillus amylolyticus]